MQEIPGKGFGAVATQPIPYDTVVMLELAVLLKISDPSPWNHKGALPLLQQALRRDLGARSRTRCCRCQGKGRVYSG